MSDDKIFSIIDFGKSKIRLGVFASYLPNSKYICEFKLDEMTDKNTRLKEIIIETEDSIYQTYKSGKGSFKVRSKWNIEKLKNGKWQIIIYEIPYQIIKSKLIEKIDNLVEDKKIPLISEITDESAENIRIVIEPKNRTYLLNF